MEVPSIFLNKLLSDVAKKNASALFLTIGSKPVLRLSEKLQTMDEEEYITNDLLLRVVENILTQEEINTLNQNREITVVKIFSGSFRFRVSVYYQKGLLSASFAYIQPNIKIFDELNYPEIIRSMLNMNNGLIIVTGPYGSGKTTTAASFIEEINKTQSRNIVTLEDPIEYVFVGKKSLVNQRQIGSDTKDLISALEYLVEEDVDVIYIGLIKENFSVCIPTILELAAGNSLVILEMNTDDTIKTLQKIMVSQESESSINAIRYNLADVLLAVLAQRLVPAVGGSVVLAKEILLANSPIKSLIREGKIQQIESVIQTSRQDGMMTLDKSLEELYKSGQIKQEDLNN